MCQFCCISTPAVKPCSSRYPLQSWQMVCCISTRAVKPQEAFEPLMCSMPHAINWSPCQEWSVESVCIIDIVWEVHLSIFPIIIIQTSHCHDTNNIRNHNRRKDLAFCRWSDTALGRTSIIVTSYMCAMKWRDRTRNSICRRGCAMRSKPKSQRCGWASNPGMLRPYVIWCTKPCEALLVQKCKVPIPGRSWMLVLWLKLQGMFDVQQNYHIQILADLEMDGALVMESDGYYGVRCL